MSLRVFILGLSLNDRLAPGYISPGGSRSTIIAVSAGPEPDAMPLSRAEA
jgi:hypothetical protein